MVKNVYFLKINFIRLIVAAYYIVMLTRYFINKIVLAVLAATAVANIG
jgi:hypothetical protein